MGLALVTGGSRGIGAAVAMLMRERGWEVLAPTRQELDFSSAISVSKFAVAQWSASVPDAVIFCHGTWFSRPIGSREEADWLAQYRLRVIEPMRLIEDFLATGREPKCIIMVSSTRGLVGGIDTGPYSAACAAQIALMQGYAREWPSIRFGCICPGLTDTAMGAEVIATGGAKPGSRPQSAEAVAKHIISLLEASSSGEVIRIVDGIGHSARWEFATC